MAPEISEIVLVDLDGQRFGLSTAHIVRIVRMVRITPLPRAPDLVEGIVDVAGQLVPVIDPRVRFQLAPRPARTSDHLIIATAGARTVAVRVDRAVAFVQTSKLQAPSTSTPGTDYIAGVSRTPDGLAVITDLNAFLSLDDEIALDAALEAVTS